MLKQNDNRNNEQGYMTAVNRAKAVVGLMKKLFFEQPVIHATETITK